MKTLLSPTVLCVLAAVPAAAAKPLFDGSFTLHVENDTFSPGGDESYTQGMELQVGLAKERSPLPFVGRLLSGWMGRRNHDSRTDLVIGQTIFTPQNIITYEPRRDDRPFVGHLYAGLSWTRTAPVWVKDGKERRPLQWSARLLAGTTGPLAQAKTAQAAFHVLRESRIPKGWDTQNGSRPELSAMLMHEAGFRLPGFCYDHANLNSMGRLVAGTVQDYAAAGLTLRFGRHLRAFAPTGIPERISVGTERSDVRPCGSNTPQEVEEETAKAAKEKEWAVFGGAEGRVFALNRLADQGGHGRPDFKRLQYEFRVGAYARWKNGFGLSYTLVRRSQEIEPLPEGLLPEHWIGMIQISKTESAAPPGCNCLARWLAGTRANIGLGRGRSHTEVSVPAVPSLSLSANWGLERSIWSDRLTLGVETTGVVREHGPRTFEPVGHQDTFLLAKVFTVGRDLVRHRSHRLHVRVGAGTGVVKTQITPAEGGIAEPELPAPFIDEGKSALAGARYMLRLGNRVSFGTGFAVARLFKLDGENTGVRKARFWRWTLSLQVHPWGRNLADAPERPTSEEQDLIR